MKLSLGEKQLFLKMKKLLERENYTVYPFNVENIDLLAEKDSTSFAFELKSPKYPNYDCIYKGIGQVLKNHLFVNKSYLIVPENFYSSLNADIKNVFKIFNVGLILCEEDTFKVVQESLFRNSKKKFLSPHFRIIKILKRRRKMSVLQLKRRLKTIHIWRFLRNLQGEGFIKIKKRDERRIHMTDEDIVEII